jgi:hypothetical protein
MAKHIMALALAVAVSLGGGAVHAADTLPSWNDTTAKKAIVDFVEKVTTQGRPGYVPQTERIVDNDGTLWFEQPVYFQLLFCT